jgi:hypothetical protein
MKVEEIAEAVANCRQTAPLADGGTGQGLALRLCLRSRRKCAEADDIIAGELDAGAPYGTVRTAIETTIKWA